MTEKTAVHYGKVELIPGIVCDGYVLNDGTAVMSLRGTANLLTMEHVSLRSMVVNWPPKTLKPFINKGLGMVVNSVKVEAKNSPYQGRNIVVYTAETIEELISAYALAFANDVLRKNQKHIGKRCVVLLKSLVKAALDTAIKQACGLSSNIQQISQQNYVELIKEFGFSCSFEGEIAIKKDITNFLDIPESTLNSFLKKHQNEIPPIKLDYATIKANGGKASRMNGYSLDNVGKIALGMDSVIGIELKKRAFGHIGTIVKPDTKGEIEWQEVLAKVFAGFGFQHNYTIGNYRVDFFVEKLMLILECNGYDNHCNYNQKKEAEREKFLKQRYSLIRFHHKVGLETLVNGILQAKMGTVIKLYNLEHLYPETGKLNLQ